MPTIHVINLSFREDRALSVIRQSKENGLDIRFWDAIEDTPTQKGICRSHKKNNPIRKG